MYDEEADLRLLYQVYSSQIEFSKNQLWRIVNYGIWAIAAIVGLFKAFDANGLMCAICLLGITAVCMICLYNMGKSWFSIWECIKRYIEIIGSLSKIFNRTIAGDNFE